MVNQEKTIDALTLSELEVYAICLGKCSTCLMDGACNLQIKLKEFIY